VLRSRLIQPERTVKFFDLDQLIQARLDILREAKVLSPGMERNEKRQLARSLKERVLIQTVLESRLRFASYH
jgi:hypothetical protein